MKKLLFLILLMFVVHSYAHDMKLSASLVKMNANVPQFLEVTLMLPFEALIIETSGISVNYEGNLLAVHSLEKSGDLWIIRAGGNCPKGHRVVCRCGGCANSGCPYCCSCYSDHKKTL